MYYISPFTSLRCCPSITQFRVLSAAVPHYFQLFLSGYIHISGKVSGWITLLEPVWHPGPNQSMVHSYLFSGYISAMAMAAAARFGNRYRILYCCGVPETDT